MATLVWSSALVARSWTLLLLLLLLSHSLLPFVPLHRREVHRDLLPLLPSLRIFFVVDKLTIIIIRVCTNTHPIIQMMG